MNWDWKEYQKGKEQFRTSYCLDCKQTKPCGILNQEYCCSCAFEKEQKETQKYSSLAKIVKEKKKEQTEKFQQLNLLKNYLGCRECRSKEVDAYDLDQENKLVCQPCLLNKKGGASGAVSFFGWSKWYQKRWGINLGECLGNFQWLPLNYQCAKKWLKDREHLGNCDCLEEEARKTVELFSNSLQESKERLRKCVCEKSEKVRVSNDYSTKCESCEKSITVASKKRVIKNRNDPRFWGLEVKERVLCLGCVGNYEEDMEDRKRYLLREYVKRGYD